jgi:glycosyltransferase involved in cell wall biosynthesis
VALRCFSFRSSAACHVFRWHEEIRVVSPNVSPPIEDQIPSRRWGSPSLQSLKGFRSAVPLKIEPDLAIPRMKLNRYRLYWSISLTCNRQLRGEARQEVVRMDGLQLRVAPSTPGPFVTVAVPTYNRVEFLKDCILSVLAQSYQHFEVLVSDNASADETPMYLATISDKRLRVIRQKSNIGLIPNWNACLTAAKGDYIVYVSDDDRIAPHFLERCVALIRIEPTLPIVMALNNTHILPKGESSTTGPKTINKPYCHKSLHTGIWEGTDILLAFLRDRFGAQMCTILMRTQNVLAKGGFPIDLPLTGDVATWAPLLLIGKCGFVCECCGTFVAHGDSQTQSRSIEIRLTEYRSAINRIIIAANDSIDDPVKLHKLKMLATRSVAHYFTGGFVWARIRGESVAEILPLVWRYRREVTKGNPSKLAVLVQFLILPASVAVRLGDFVAGTRVKAAKIPALKRIYRRLIPSD